MRSKPRPHVLHLSRQLRKSLTETESLLWSRVRNRQLGGFKFRRQHPIGRFIADFYCHELRLVVEVDGDVHLMQRQREYDSLRQEQLEAQGYRVVRVKTEEVKNDINGVLQKILGSHYASPLPPLPGERGVTQ